VVILLLSLVGASVVNSTVIKFGNDGTDRWFSINTMIRNSNGKYWSATGANLQLAINDVDGNGTVYLPQGTFTITTNIIIESGVKLQGSGMDSTILKAADSTYVAPIHTTNENNISIYDLTIDGNEDNGATGNAINIGNCTDFFVNNVYLLNYSGNGLRIYDDSTRGHISNVFSYCDLDTVQSFGFNDAENITMTNCYGWNNEGWVLDITQSSNCSIVNLILSKLIPLLSSPLTPVTLKP
jgi:hypothetical protein